LRVHPGPLGRHLISHQEGETVVGAVQAIEDMERQLGARVTEYEEK
jgi:hypothetical protein